MQYTNIRQTNTVYVSLRTDSIHIAPNTQQAEWSNVSFEELRLGTETGNRCYRKLHKITIKVSAYSRHDGTWGNSGTTRLNLNPLNAELNPICYLLALLGAHHFLHVSRIRVKLLTFRLLMSYIYGAPILDVSRSHTTTHHSR